jgi:hypothetical protein
VLYTASVTYIYICNSEFKLVVSGVFPLVDGVIRACYSSLLLLPSCGIPGHSGERVHAV